MLKMKLVLFNGNYMKETFYLLKLIKNYGSYKMQLLTTSLRKQLIANYHANKEAQEEGKEAIDFAPVVKFFFPVGTATWLITEMDEEEMMFGLCDLGHGFPELGYVHLHELQNTKGMNGMLSVERDMHWKAKGTLQDYTNKAQLHGRIVA